MSLQTEPGHDWREGETAEFKERWSDRALEDIAAFANHKGGNLWLGVRDDGTVVGFVAGDKELQSIANQVVDVLGLRPSIEWHMAQGKHVLAVSVVPTSGMVACKGRYLTRVGSTNREMSLDQMAAFLLRRSGQSWDGLSIPESLGAISPDALQRFVRLARNRLPRLGGDDPVDQVLTNLSLLRDGRLTAAALLLFGEHPQHAYPTAQLRIGRFKNATTIVDDRTLSGDLLSQVEAALQVFRQYLQVRYEFPGRGEGLEALQRQEIWEYPLAALREAIVNALVHRDYTAIGDIQVRVYDDQVSIWSPGGFPEGITASDLQQERHLSKPRNPLLAQIFYYAELVERWGTGASRMIAACLAQGLPAPRFEEAGGGVRVTFLKELLTLERLQALGLNDRQIAAVGFVKEHGSITNQQYRKLTGRKERSATLDLNELVVKGIMMREGRTGRGTSYFLIKAQNPQ